MYLIDILEQLTQGELRELELAGSEGDRFLPANYVRIIPHINLGLAEIYKRFDLSRKLTNIRQYEGIQHYQLKKQFAQTNTESTEPTRYIEDTVENPFLGDVIKLDYIYDDMGNQIRLNDATAMRDGEVTNYGMTSYDTIQIHSPCADKVIQVVYRSHLPKLEVYTKHPTTGIKNVQIDPETTYIDLPLPYLEPLLYYVASRATAGMGAVDGAKDSTMYLQLFEASCRKLLEIGLVVEDNTTNEKLNVNGWV